MTPDFERERVKQALLLQSMMEVPNPNRRVSDFVTNPGNICDKVLWPLLRPLMKAAAMGKISHWWHYINLPEGLSYEGLALPGDPAAFKVDSRLIILRKLQLIRMSLGGWKTAYMIAPGHEELDVIQMSRGWRYAFEEVGENPRRQFCSIVSTNPVIILAGPHDFRAIGLQPDSFKEVPLVAAGPFPNRAQLPIL